MSYERKLHCYTAAERRKVIYGLEEIVWGTVRAFLPPRPEIVWGTVLAFPPPSPEIMKAQITFLNKHILNLSVEISFQHFYCLLLYLSQMFRKNTSCGTLQGI